MYIYKVGIVGAGTMGAQIAHVVSLAGLPVVLTDVSEALAQRGMQAVRAMYEVRVSRGKLTPEQLEKKCCSSRLRPTRPPSRRRTSSLRQSRRT